MKQMHLEMDYLDDLELSDFLLDLPILESPGDNLDFADINDSYIQTETVTTTLKNFADEEFLFEMDVPDSHKSQDDKGVPMYKARFLDMDSITRRLFENAVNNCDRLFRVDEHTILDIANKLRGGIVYPKHPNEEDCVLFRLAPAIALDRSLGGVVAFGLGQLVVRNTNVAKRRMIFQGCARDIHSQQMLIESVSQSLLICKDEED